MKLNEFGMSMLTEANVLPVLISIIAWFFGTSVGFLIMFNYWLWMM